MAAGAVSEALRADLARMSDEVAGSSLAALALAMAEQVDEKATAIMCAELASLIVRLRELSPPARAATRLDALREARAERLGS